MDRTHDVVIVGGGIAGSALAAVLARDGFDVLVLERQTSYRDKVRGETLLCWGVAELQQQHPVDHAPIVEGRRVVHAAGEHELGGTCDAGPHLAGDVGDGSPGQRVHAPAEEPHGPDGEPGLLGLLAHRGALRALAGLDAAGGELPAQVALAHAAPHQQDPAVPDDDGGRDAGQPAGAVAGHGGPARRYRIPTEASARRWAAVGRAGKYR